MITVAYLTTLSTLFSYGLLFAFVQIRDLFRKILNDNRIFKSLVRTVLGEIIMSCRDANWLQAPTEDVKPTYLQYAKLEDYGLAKRAMKVYDQAAKAVPDREKMSMYEIYIARASSIFGIPKTREIYEV